MSTIISLNLSVESIATEIYAASALRAVLGSENRDNPLPVLNRSHRKALNRVIADAYTRTAMSMLHRVEAIDDEHLDAIDDDTILTMEVRASNGFSAGLALCRAVEHAIAMQALHLCHVGMDGTLATRYETLHSDAVATVLAMLRRGGRLPQVTPHWI